MQEKSLFKTFEHFKEPIAVCNSDEIISYSNSEFQKLFHVANKGETSISSIFTEKDPYVFKNILRFLEHREEYNNSFYLSTVLNHNVKFYLTVIKVFK